MKTGELGDKWGMRRGVRWWLSSSAELVFHALSNGATTRVERTHRQTEGVKSTQLGLGQPHSGH